MSDTQPAVIHPAGIETEEPLAAGADTVELVLELVALAECADVVATADDDGDDDDWPWLAWAVQKAAAYAWSWPL